MVLNFICVLPWQAGYSVLNEVCGIQNRETCRRQTRHRKQAGDSLPLASYGELSYFQTVDGLDTDTAYQ